MLAHSQKYSRASIEQMCKRQPTIAWCPEGIRQTDTSMLPIKEIREIGTSAYSHFIYAREKEDLWFDRSYEADLGIKWYGDCDDITTTTLSRLHAAGQPLDKMWMLLVDIDRKELIDHIVGVVQDDLGQFWVVGDTSKRRHTYPLHSMKYRPMIIARMDNPTNWQAVTQSTVMQGFPLVLAR
jgi:predicted transglutaminase-like cysteine proteinase